MVRVKTDALFKTAIHRLLDPRRRGKTLTLEPTLRGRVELGRIFWSLRIVEHLAAEGDSHGLADSLCLTQAEPQGRPLTQIEIVHGVIIIPIDGSVLNAMRLEDITFRKMFAATQFS